MRIAVVGAGAIGGYLAARLALGGHDVSVVARGAHLDAIRRDGLTLQSAAGRETAQVAASDAPEAFGPQDVVIVAAKTPALPELMPRIAPLCGPRTPVVNALNGVFWWYGAGFAPGGATPDTSRLDPDGALAAAVPASRAVGMIVYSANEVAAPGVVRNNGGSNRYLIGAADPAEHAATAALAGNLSGCGFAIEATADIRLEMWRKLALNLSSAPLAILTGATLREMGADPDVAALSWALRREAHAVAAAHGLDLGAAPPPPTEPRPAHKPSMLQDLERGRPMEIDSMLAIVQDFARQSGVATPTLDALMPLVWMRARKAGCV